jgi:oligopeptide transport system permease protein
MDGVAVMLLVRKLCISLLMWLTIVVLFTLLLLQPGQVEFTSTVPTYKLYLMEYIENIDSFFKELKENKGLGDTKYRTSVSEEVARHMFRSIKPIMFAFIISIFLGVLKGILDYRKRVTKVNVLGKGTTWLFQSIPDFLIIIGIISILHLMMRFGFPQVSIYGYDQWSHVILPTLILSIYPSMYIARITSSKFEEQVNQLYIRTAHSKGLTDNVIIYKHMLGNCWGTILSHFSSIMMYILSNLLVVEYLLYYKGGAYRLLESFGFSHTVAPNSNDIEVNMALGLGLSFMLLVYIAQLVSQVTQYYLEPYKGGK